MMATAKKIKPLYWLASILLVILTAVFCIYWHFLHTFTLNVIRREIKLPPDYKLLDGKKLVFFSDLHAIDTAQDLNHLRQIIRVINNEKPDLIFFCGDLAASDNFEWKQPPSRVVARLRNLHAKYGVYAVAGNHDWYCQHGIEIVYVLEQVGIRVLENKSVTIPGVCNIAGVQDKDGPIGPDVAKALENIDPALPTLAIMHRPEYWELFPDTVKLFFAGHTHGGQINLPILRQLLLKYTRESQYEGHEYQKGNGQRLFITYGIGTSWIRLRINCPSEIIIIEFRR